MYIHVHVMYSAIHTCINKYATRSVGMNGCDCERKGIANLIVD